MATPQLGPLQCKDILDCVEVGHVIEVQDLIELKFSQHFNHVFMLVNSQLIHEGEDTSLPKLFPQLTQENLERILVDALSSKKRFSTLLSVEMAAVKEM